VTKPTLLVDVAFSNNPLDASYTWTDISARVRSFTWHVGRQDLLQRSEVGEGELVLKNQNRAFDPTNTASVYYPNVAV